MKIESNNFGIRKNLLEYDQVMNEQREIIYAERRRVLERREHAGSDLQDDHGYRGQYRRYVLLPMKSDSRGLGS